MENDADTFVRSAKPAGADHNHPSVAVIGAGISGMACARLLAKHGYPVTVFEKEHHVGGRASILQDGHGSYDHGCQYFTARDKRFQTHVNQLVEQGSVAVWPLRLASCLHGMVHRVENDSAFYVGVPGMNAISRAFSAGINMREGTIVSTMKRVNDEWKLIAGGKRESYDVVVVSAPAELTAQLAKGYPFIATEAAKVKTHPCLSVTVGFDHTLNASFDAAHFSSCPVMWASNHRTKPGRSHDEIWTIQATPEWSDKHFSSPEDMIGKILLSTFFESSGLPPVVPNFSRTHKWYYGWPLETLKKDCLWDKENGVGACGDWCQAGRMEGAFLSGVSLAEQIIKDMQVRG